MVGKISLVCPTVGYGHSDDWWSALVWNTDFSLLEEIIIVWDAPEELHRHIICKNYDGRNGGGRGLAVRGGSKGISEVPIRTIINPHPVGISRAFNMGASIAIGEKMCFLEDQIFVPPGWLESLLKVLDRRPDFGWVAPAQVENPAATFTSMCSLIARTAFRVVGGYDERFEVFDDADLLLRLRKEGFDPHGISDIKVSHPESRTTTSRLRGGRDSPEEQKHFIEMMRRFKEKWNMDDFDWKTVPVVGTNDSI